MKKKPEYVLSLVIVDNQNRGTIDPSDLWQHLTLELLDGLEVTYYKVRRTGSVEPGTEPAWIPVPKERNRAKA